MNYLKEIIAFSERAAMEGLSAGQISLGYALLAIDNKTGWKEWFTVSRRMLELYSGQTSTSIKKNREVLKELGIIDFKFNGMEATSYKIISQALFDKISVQDSFQDSFQDSAQSGVPLYKQNKNKQNKRNYYNSARKSKFNNYDDENTIDYAKLEEEIFNEMLSDTEDDTNVVS